MSMKSGFSLVELMVAVAAASILTLSAWTCFSQFYKNGVRLEKQYAESSRDLLQKLRCVVPYPQRNCVEYQETALPILRKKKTQD